MRVAVVVLVLFVVLYACVTAWDVGHHAREPSSSSSDRPATPSLVGAWPLVPPFLKVGPGDVSPPPPYVVNAGSALTLFVSGVSSWYQPHRLMRLVYTGSSPVGSVALSYPPASGPVPTQSPDPLTAAQPSQVVVLPQQGAAVVLACKGFFPCRVSL